MNITKPNLFIVGAPKAGTSFLYQQLKNHKELSFPKVKELNHFSKEDIDGLGSYYKDFKIRDRKKYLNFFSSTPEVKFCVDASVSYFAFKNVPKKIFDFNPGAKFLIVLRNPIKRAFSHFLMDERMGYAKSSFNSYITLNELNKAHYHQYIHNSLYYENISNYYSVFGKAAVKVMVLEEMEQELPSLFEFLEISPNSMEIDTSERVNQNKKPKNFVSRILQKNRNLTSRLKLVVPESIIKKYNSFLYVESEKKEMSDEDYNLVSELISDDLDKLERLLGRDLKSVWKIS
jgi:hypothetical protein